MKRDKRHIAIACIVMICFFAGQWAVYAHQHKTFPRTAKTAHHTASFSEKCQLCDAMHHTSAVQNDHHYFATVVSAGQHYIQSKYDFISVSLILAAGRAPPVS
ncbi:MAG: hypothetical protein JST19_13380 [Bacteroidetes bacterium]|nr:hypothetical protein [Bacteroidota bacterium]